MSKQLNKKVEDRNIVIKVNPKIMVPLVGFFLCAAIGAWFGWSLRTADFWLPPIGTGNPFRDWDSSTVVCALIAGLVGYAVCWRWVKGIMSDFFLFFLCCVVNCRPSWLCYPLNMSHPLQSFSQLN